MVRAGVEGAEAWTVASAPGPGTVRTSSAGAKKARKPGRGRERERAQPLTCFQGIGL